ncbi:MAG: hypothetical protein H7Z16_04815 [Pyrinomonadaceae bacterium]|nr:hypothetical protein [Pyrinomonadaceae bacterium]
MTENLIEGGMILIATVVSLAVGFTLFRNAKAHERSAQALGAKIERAGINLRQG